MNIKPVYFLTNVASPYRKHQFELIAKRFPNSVFCLTRHHAAYRPWSNRIDDWKANIKYVTQGELYWDLLTQKWGTVHVGDGAGMSIIYGLLLTISALFGHSRKIDWNDGYSTAQIAARRLENKKPVTLRRRIMQWLMRKAKVAVWTPGRNGAEMAKLMGYPEDRIINAYFSHDIDTFMDYDANNHGSARARVRESLGIGADKVVLLNISRYMALKRLEDIAEALSLIEREHPEIAAKFEFILVGDGDWTAHLDMLATLKIVKVHLVKQMPPDELLPYYCASDMFVFPSEGDIWGLVVNEALSMGLPVICSDAVGADELVRDGKNGYSVPIRSPKAIAEKLVLLADLNRRERFSAEAKKIKDTWRTDFGIDALERYLERS